ncbi:MAG: hypothetical protein ACRDYV_02400 [Acidimicrobiia bacterium]
MTTDRTEKDPPRVRPFADFLVDQAGGRTHAELSDALHDLTSAVQATGRKGALTLTVTVEPMKGNTQALLVTDKVTAKPPAADRKSSVFFADAQGNLSRHDPRQMHLPLREVPGADPAADQLRNAT